MAQNKQTNQQQTSKSTAAKKQESLYELMRRYDKKAFKSIYSKKSFATERERDLYNKKMAKANSEKIHDLREVLRRIEYSHKKFFEKLGVSVSNLQFESTFNFGENFRGRNIVALSYNGTSSKGQEQHNQIFLHMNMEKLLQLPAFEAYTLISAQVTKSIMEKTKLYQSYNPEKLEELHSFKRGQLSIAQQRKYNEATKLLTQYVDEYLKAEDKEFDGNIVQTGIVVSQLLANMSEQDMENFLKHNFASISSVSEFLDEQKAMQTKRSLLDERLATLYNEDRKKVKVDKYGLMANKIDVEKIANKQQYLQLAEAKLKKDFENLKGNTNNQEALRGFCSKFVDQFAQMHGMEAVELRFTNNPKSTNYGAFHDKGSSQWIEVNLANINSVTELAATLAHELTHAGDAAINKKMGNTNKNGTGLVNNISNNISNSGFKKDSASYNLLKRVNDSCYYINPNERHARLGEYCSFAIMQELAKDNPVMQAQLKASLEDHRGYLENTVAQIKNINANIGQYEAELARLDIPKGSGGYEMIERRIAYLKQLKDSIGLGAEEAHIKTVNKMIDTIEKQAQEGSKESDKQSNQMRESDENESESERAERLRREAEEEKKRQEKENEEEFANALGYQPGQ